MNAADKEFAFRMSSPLLGERDPDSTRRPTGDHSYARLLFMYDQHDNTRFKQLVTTTASHLIETSGESGAPIFDVLEMILCDLYVLQHNVSPPDRVFGGLIEDTNRGWEILDDFEAAYNSALWGYLAVLDDIPADESQDSLRNFRIFQRNWLVARGNVYAYQNNITEDGEIQRSVTQETAASMTLLLYSFPDFTADAAYTHVQNHEIVHNTHDVNAATNTDTAARRQAARDGIAFYETRHSRLPIRGLVDYTRKMAHGPYMQLPQYSMRQERNGLFMSFEGLLALYDTDLQSPYAQHMRNVLNVLMPYPTSEQRQWSAIAYLATIAHSITTVPTITVGDSVTDLSRVSPILSARPSLDMHDIRAHVRDAHIPSLAFQGVDSIMQHQVVNTIIPTYRFAQHSNACWEYATEHAAQYRIEADGPGADNPDVWRPPVLQDVSSIADIMTLIGWKVTSLSMPALFQLALGMAQHCAIKSGRISTTVPYHGENVSADPAARYVRSRYHNYTQSTKDGLNQCFGYIYHHMYGLTYDTAARSLLLGDTYEPTTTTTDE